MNYTIAITSPTISTILSVRRNQSLSIHELAQISHSLSAQPHFEEIQSCS
ncbi:hypothetical protein [Pajaroellobacter abortibovis]|nr:hypothetical protein [Pajaroellobacter abortibovis]